MSDNALPSYQECVEMCQSPDSVFYEVKRVVDGFQISFFNYRLASFKNFSTLKSRELRGLTFVFNQDGSLYKRFVLLEKFFNLNQTPDSMYSVVKNYKIKFISNKEDGSIASFIQLPNGRIIGRSKIGLDNEQAKGINRVYANDKKIRNFVNYCLSHDIVPIFEYVLPLNRIVLKYSILKYSREELILLRLRDNNTGAHLDITEYMWLLNGIRIAAFENDVRDLDHLIELTAVQIEKEGSIVTCVDNEGRDFFFKIKTPWYCERHRLLTEDIHREHIIIGYILDDKVDDILGLIPEEEKDAHDKIQKIINIVRSEINTIVSQITEAYKQFLQMGADKKHYALTHRNNNPNFHFVMKLDKHYKLKAMLDHEAVLYYQTIENWQKQVDGCDAFSLASDHIRDATKQLNSAREWLKTKDSNLFFIKADEVEES